MAGYRPDGPISAADVFNDILTSGPTNLTQILGLNHQGDFGARTAGGGAAETFGTLSGAKSPTKPVVFGLIPPDVMVDFVPVERVQVQTKVGGAGGGGGGEPPDLADRKKWPFGAFIPYPPSFYLKLAAVAKRINCQPEDLMAVLCSESGLNPTSTNNGSGTEPYAIGLNQLTPPALTAAGMTPEFFKTQWIKLSAEDQLDYVGNCFLAITRGKEMKTAADVYTADMASGFLGKPPGTIVYPAGSDGAKALGAGGEGQLDKNFGGLDGDGDGAISVAEIGKLGTFAKNKPLFKQHLVQLQAALAAGAAPADVPGQGGSVMSNGVVTDPEGGDPLYNTGRNIQRASAERVAAAEAQTNELRQQIRVARSIPALALLVNPQKFTRSYEHTVDAVKVRRGYAVHVWNERPLSISCSGTTSAQYAFRADGMGGLTHFNRLYSASYKNLMSLVQLYRNNGHIYRGAPNEDPYNRFVPTISMSVFIYYDGKIYVGSFDDFTVTDDAEKPFNMSYSFKFTVRYEIEVPASAQPGRSR